MKLKDLLLPTSALICMLSTGCNTGSENSTPVESKHHENPNQPASQVNVFYVMDTQSKAFEDSNILKSPANTSQEQPSLADGLTYKVIYENSNESSLPGKTVFLSRLRSEENSRSNKGICIFIHGYRTGEKDFSKLCLDISKRLNMLVLAYDWESTNTYSGYFADGSHAQASVARFVSLLSAIKPIVDPGKTKLIAHSMGNVILINGLANLDKHVETIGGVKGKEVPLTTLNDNSLSSSILNSLSTNDKKTVSEFDSNWSRKPNKYELVMLYSGDETATVFKQRFYDVLMQSNSVVQLINVNDKATAISGKLHGDEKIARTFMPPIAKATHAYQTIEYSALTEGEGPASPQHSMKPEYLAALIASNGQTAPVGTKFTQAEVDKKFTSGTCYYKKLSLK